MPSTCTISVVMPALNEERNIGKALLDAISAFHRLKIDGEIIVVNDGSSDKTAEVVNRFQEKHPFIRMIHHEKPHGFGKSFWDGVQHAQGTFVTLLPGDAENDGYEILRYLPLMEHVDLVIPWVFNRKTRSPLRRVVSKTFLTIVNLTFNTNLNYFNGTVLYRRSILKGIQLNSTGYFFQTELIIKLLRSGYLYAEVPYGLKIREDGTSSALSVKSFSRLAKDYLRLYSSRNHSKPCLESISHQRTLEFEPTASPNAKSATHRLVPQT